MAHLAMIYLANGTNEIGVNVSKTVGNGGRNDSADVMLIQALFNYIGKEKLGLGADYEMPAVTGVMDGETYSAIGEFQLHWGARLFAKGFGWRIEPARYKGRRIRLERRLMAITLLHVLAREAASAKGEANYPEALAKMHPELDRNLEGGHFFEMGPVTLVEEPLLIHGPGVLIEQEEPKLILGPGVLVE